jgi:hypothetical protein
MSISWFKVEERLALSLLEFVRGIDMLKALSCLFNSSDTHAYPTRHDTRGLFTVPKYRTDYGRHTVLHRTITTWNCIPHQITDASSRFRFKKQIKNTFFGTAGTGKQKHRHRHMHTTHDNTYTIHTYTWIL